MQLKFIPIRNLEFRSLLEYFLVSAIAAILGIRIFLELTNFPQIGGRNLHISHMLWGGMLLFIAVSLLLTYLNNHIKRVAAVIGGLGFGIFIDELGKFITKDNNYFYQPTFSIIYIIFILLFIALRSYSQKSIFSPKEYLVNSLELIKEAVINDLDVEEKARALAYLEKVDQHNPITRSLHHLYQQLDTIPKPKPNIISRLWYQSKTLYRTMIAKRWFGMAINCFFLGKFVGSIFDTFAFITSVSVIFFHLNLAVNPKNLLFSEVAYLFSLTLSGIFIILGVLNMRRSRLTSFRMYKRSLLVSILLTYVFLFYRDQLQAFGGLMFNIFILVGINYLIEQEKTVRLEK